MSVEPAGTAGLGHSGSPRIGYRRRVKRMTWVPVVVALGLMIGGASWSLAGVSAATGVREARAVSAGGQGYEVMLVAPVQGGLLGWCMTYQSPGRIGGKCPVIPAAGRPILAESFGFSPSPPVTEVVAVTTGQVASVSVGGARSSVPTRAEPGLPYGFRAAFVEVPGPAPSPESRPRMTALDSNGQPIPVAGQPVTPSQYGLESSSWRRPARPPHGTCRLVAAPLPGLVAEGGRVVLRLRSFTGLIGRPFLSCIDTEYRLNNQPLDAGVILDATHPGAAPAPLPGMRPVHSHHGVFQAPGWSGKLVGRRIRGAWLLVEGGGLSQRLTVLEHLRATVSA